MSEERRSWVYHETEEPKIILNSEFEEYEKEGWKDSPIYFVKTTDFGVDSDDDVKVQQLGDAIEGVKESLNGALNIDRMNETELMEYADKHYQIDINPSRKRKLPRLKREVQALIDRVSD